MNGMVIKQLEKALECKDDKELRLRVEVLLDILKEQPERPFVPSQQPTTPPPIWYKKDDSHKPIPMPTELKVTGKKGNQVRSAGSITSFDSEQITYRRPPNT